MDCSEWRKVGMKRTKGMRKEEEKNQKPGKEVIAT